jgi:hypothetical protein
LESPIPLPVSHYLYFRIERAAQTVAAKLDQHDFRTEVKPSTNKDSWLVLAQHEIHPTEARLADLRARLSRIAVEAGGEYDGWEAKFARH